MGDRFSNSWRLVKASAAVLRQDRELIVFPIVSMIASILVMASFAIPLFLTGAFDQMEQGQTSALGYVLAFLFYLVQYTVIFFCNTALVGAAMIRLRGGDPTVSDGFRISAQRFPTILGYAFISATVGMILRMISERVGWLGQFVISLVGFAWSVATFLVVPILAVENIGPVDAVKRSANLLKHTWGEQLIGNTGMGFAFGLLAFGLILVSVPLFMLAAAAGSSVLIFGTIALIVLAFVALGLIGSALSGIYTAAVYNYAVGGANTVYFSPEMVQNAFQRK